MIERRIWSAFWIARGAVAAAMAAAMGLSLVHGCGGGSTGGRSVSEGTRVPSARPDTEIVARGNEPFWSVTVTHTAILYSDPERPEGLVGPYAPATHEGARLVFHTVLRDSITQPLELAIEQRPCSDGMSDKAYSYSAVATLGTRKLTGCAERPARH